MKSLGIGFGMIFFIWFLSMVISISFSEPSHASEKMVDMTQPPEGVVTRGGSYAWAYDEEKRSLFFCIVPLQPPVGEGSNNISCIVYPREIKHLSEYDKFINEEPIF